MTESKFIRKLLGLQELVVLSYEFRESDHCLVLEVKPWGQMGCCPHCRKRCEIVASTPQEREWQDVPVLDWTLCLRYRPREVWCPRHGRHQEWVSFAAPYARITYRLEYLLLHHCKAMSQKVAAKLLGMAPSTLSENLHRIIQRERQGHCIKDVRKIGIDEISHCKGHKYATVVYDLERHKVIWVGEGKARETIDLFFTHELTLEQRAQIIEASCDMSETFIGAIKAHCPHAKLTLDRFHLVKGLQKAVDAVRQEAWQAASSKTEKKYIKGLCWLLRLHGENRHKGQTRRLNELQRHNRRIWRAWILKEEFNAIFDYVNPGCGKKTLRSWLRSAYQSGLEPMRRFARSVEKHFEEILNYIETRMTNAAAEGINRLLRMANNRASGFRNLESFADIIYLIAGDVDILGQIPVRFRRL